MRLAEIRKSRSLNQKDVADALDIPITTYRKYEYESRQVPMDVLLKLADFYDISLDYLVGAERSPEEARKIQLDSLYKMMDNSGKDLLLRLAIIIVKSGDYLSI